MQELLVGLSTTIRPVRSSLYGMDVSYTEELAADMMSLLASFSGKFYGKRSAERRTKKKSDNI